MINPLQVSELCQQIQRLSHVVDTTSDMFVSLVPIIHLFLSLNVFLFLHLQFCLSVNSHFCHFFSPPSIFVLFSLPPSSELSSSFNMLSPLSLLPHLSFYFYRSSSTLSPFISLQRSLFSFHSQHIVFSLLYFLYSSHFLSHPLGHLFFLAFLCSSFLPLLFLPLPLHAHPNLFVLHLFSLFQRSFSLLSVL